MIPGWAGRRAGLGCTPAEFAGVQTTCPTAQLAGGLWRADAEQRRARASALPMTALAGAQGQRKRAYGGPKVGLEGNIGPPALSWLAELVNRGADFSCPKPL